MQDFAFLEQKSMALDCIPKHGQQLCDGFKFQEILSSGRDHQIFKIPIPIRAIVRIV